MTSVHPIIGASDPMEDPSLYNALNKRNTSVEVREDSEEYEDNTLYERRFFGLKLPAYFNKHPERKLVRKLDTFIFSYTVLSSFIQNLDNTNIYNAYVSGMQDDLSLFGNELNLFSTFFNVGIIVGAIPLILLATHIRPSLLMPACELGWSVLVMGIGGAKSAKTVYALRFFIGFFEAIAFPGFASVLGAWYTPAELGKRMAMYEVSSNIAGMFSGYIQAGLYAHMDGRSGLRGWQWLFIFDGLISVPIALWGFYALPDQPSDSRARWLTEADRGLAKDRMERAGRKPVLKITWTRFKSIFNTWHVYGFAICYTFYGAFSWGDGYFNLWLQYLNVYSVQQLNTIPTAGQGAAVVNSLISGVVSDAIGNRPIVIVWNMFLCMFGNASLAVWSAPTPLKFLGYILITTGLPAQSLTITWLSEVCQGNATLRGLIVSIGNTLVYTINSFALVLLFPAVDAPHYKHGYAVCAVFIGLAIVSVGIILLLIRGDLKSGRAYRNDAGQLEYAKWQQAGRDGEELPVAQREQSQETSEVADK